MSLMGIPDCRVWRLISRTSVSLHNSIFSKRQWTFSVVFPEVEIAGVALDTSFSISSPQRRLTCFAIWADGILMTLYSCHSFFHRLRLGDKRVLRWRCEVWHCCVWMRWWAVEKWKGSVTGWLECCEVWKVQFKNIERHLMCLCDLCCIHITCG